MTSILRRKAAAVALVVLALTLAGGGMAVAKPSAQPAAEAQALRQPRANAQPPVTTTERSAAKAALAKGDVGTLAVGTLYAAVVEQNPVTGVWQVTRASHAGTTVTQIGVGWFSVNFPVNVATAVHTATIGTTKSQYVPPSGEIAVAPRRDLVNSVFVATRNSGGGNKSLPFHLVVLSIV